MKTYRFGKDRLSVSCDFKEEVPENEAEEYLQYLMIWKFTRRLLIRTLLFDYGRLHKLEGYAVLMAHGESRQENWVFYDNQNTGKPFSVQNWIDRKDGRFLGIFLYCCNERGHTISSDNSIVIHARDKITLDDLSRGNHIQIYVPEYGYIGGNYRKLNQAIAETRAKLRKQ